MKIMMLRYFLILSLFGQILSTELCPVGCSCSQNTVRCIRMNLSHIPEIPTDTTIFDLRYNHIHEIPSDAFKGLSFLHTIFLNDNQIGFIHGDAFRGLLNLKYLYLNNNRISRIIPEVFQGLNQLQIIYLENNDIWEFDSITFSNLPKLYKLFLSKNKITVLHKKSFENLPNLQRLRLDKNPIDCNCEIQSLLKKFKESTNKPTVFLTCSSPSHLAGKIFDNLSYKNDFHCEEPKIILEPKDIEIKTGDTVELNCLTVGDPQPEVLWMKNSSKIHPDKNHMQIFRNGSLKILHVKDNDSGTYECMAKNSLGEIKSRPARMIVNQYQPLSQLNKSPKFILRPLDVVITSFDNVFLHCLASGVPPPNIRWYINGQPVDESFGQTTIFPNGSLIIKSPTTENEGIYLCEASNYLGTIHASSRVTFNDLPNIFLAPESQTVKSGSTLILECDAEGEPQPNLWWKRNETRLSATVATTNRIHFLNDNTELQIEHIKVSDSGLYTCVAENTNGRSEADAEVIVENAWGPPRLIFEPYDLDVIPGATVELPCKGEGDPLPQIKWRKDGRTLAALIGKYRIASSGSLYIQNATMSDTGRYECSISNDYGRVTGSGLVSVRSNEILAPGDRFVYIAYEEASKEIDQAINKTIEALFRNRKADNSQNYGDLFRLFNFPNAPARQLARAAEIYERTLSNIRKHTDTGATLKINSTKYEYKELLSSDHLHLVAELSGCMEHRKIPNCTDMCYHSKYRSIDGTCNNLDNPMWGASLTSFRRIYKPIYENGFSMPMGWSKGKLYNGFQLPSARAVSTSLISTKDITADDKITHMVMQWGQFLDHDLDHAIPSVSSESWDGVDCKRTCEYSAPCYPIDVPQNDPRIKNRRCIDFVRSSAICGSGMTSVFFDEIHPREQINQLTSFIDASQVYGYSEAFAQELRNLTSENGRLRTGVHFPNQKDMLPFAAPQDGIDCRRRIEESNINCFLAGDIRVNEQVGLLAMHIIWMREHNRLADKLKKLNPHWDGDMLYDEARKIVGAQVQHITYKHWLPLILGKIGMNMLGDYTGYKSNVNPSISNEFATAALRFGHSLINPVLHRYNEKYKPIPQGNLELHKAFFSPWRLVYEGGVDPLMRGMFSVPAKLKKSNQNLNSELTEKLFHNAHAVALDLAAINIQRSRDHGIPGYNDYRKFCNMKVAENFEDLSNEISNKSVRDKLKSLYGHPSNIDLWVGGILEDVIDDSKVGPLFRCLLVEQFKALRDGDRFFYENPSVFLPEQLQEIKKSSLARILCDNGDNITEATKNVFILPEKQESGFTGCNNFPGINLYFWQDCGSCHSLPTLLKSHIPETYRRKRSTVFYDENQKNNILYDNDLIDMNEERVSGLEEMINKLQKDLKKIKRKFKNIEQNLTIRNIKHKRQHCIDKSGSERLNNETWNKDECTKCQCNYSQITCITQKCPQIICQNNIESIKIKGECCPQCMTETSVFTDIKNSTQVDFI